MKLHTKMSLVRRSGRRSAGFTLIELVLVLTIISVLVGSGIYMIVGQSDVANEIRIEGDIKTIATQLKTYESRNYRPPTTEQGLMALVEKPTSQPTPPRWLQLYDDVPIDPWGQPYRYAYTPRKDGKSGKVYDIWSIGADGVDGTEDDMGNWKPGQANK